MKKHVVGHLIFYSLVSLFAIHFLFGTQGVYYLYTLKKNNASLTQDIVQQKREIATIASELSAWQRHDFFKEQLAREQLQLANTDDIVYYLA